MDYVCIIFFDFVNIFLTSRFPISYFNQSIIEYSDKIEGKVENAFDEETLILNDKGIKKAVSWDRIEYIVIIEHTEDSSSNQKVYT